jgi:hypothetical protein
MLAKIISDLIVVVTMGLPKVEGMSDEEKKAMLASLQANTNKLVEDITAMANQ